MAKAAAKKKLPVWNLKDLYDGHNSPQIVKDINTAVTLAHRFTKNYAGRVDQLDPAAFTFAVKEYETLGDLLGKLASYSQLLYQADMSKPHIAQFAQNIQE